MFRRMLFRTGRLLLAWLIASTLWLLAPAPASPAVSASLSTSPLSPPAIVGTQWIILTDQGPSTPIVAIPAETDVYWYNATGRTQVLQGYRDNTAYLPLVYHGANGRDANDKLVASPQSGSFMFPSEQFRVTLQPNEARSYYYSNPGIFTYSLLTSPQVRGQIHVQPSPALVQFRIAYQYDSAYVGDTLYVAVLRIIAPSAIQRVTASVGDRQIDMLYTQEAICPLGPPCYPGWAGDISLLGMPRGPMVLTVKAIDTIGNVGQTQDLLFHDAPPRLTIREPDHYTIARPEIGVALTCQDDDPTGCASVTVRAAGIPLISTGVVTMVDQLISLARFDGTATSLTFEARDSVGHEAWLERTVLVESNQHLVEVEHIDPGPMHHIDIQDVQPERILYHEKVGNTGVFKIRQRATGQESTVESLSGRELWRGSLTPTGIVYTAVETTISRTELYEWRNDHLVSLGKVSGEPSINGSYASWVGPASADNEYAWSLFRRDFLAGTTTSVTSTIAPNVNDISVAANGDVVYAAQLGYPTPQIWRYRGGVSTRLSSDIDLHNIEPVTDGDNVAYRKLTPLRTDQPQTSTLMLYDANGRETILAPARRYLGGTAGREYMVNGGWIAFTRLDTNGIVQVWLRYPNGVDRQVTTSDDPDNQDSYIQNLSPTGEIISVHSNRLYLHCPGLSAVDIAAANRLYQTYWLNGEWFLAVWGYLFKVVP